MIPTRNPVLHSANVNPINMYTQHQHKFRKYKIRGDSPTARTRHDHQGGGLHIVMCVDVGIHATNNSIPNRDRNTCKLFDMIK